MSIRIIEPKRGVEGTTYHFCPLKEDNIGYQDCSNCPHLEQVEHLEVKYRIHCNLPFSGVQLYDFNPPKAYDTAGGYKGDQVLLSPRHSVLEPKMDGVRAIVHCTPDGVFITSRRRNKEGQFNQFQDAVPHLRDNPFLRMAGEYGTTIFDAELIAPVDDDTLAVTMGIVGAKPERAIQKQNEVGFANLHIFDLIRFEDLYLVDALWFVRDEHLDEIFRNLENPYIKRVPSTLVLDPRLRQDIVKQFLMQGYEGAILKDPNAAYFDSRSWLKYKTKVSVDTIITGWELGAKGGQYENTLATLKVSVIDKATGELREIAKVGPGDEETREKWASDIMELSPYQITARQHILELEGQVWTKDGRIRHPRVLRYRLDRSQPNTIDFSQFLVG